MNEETRRKIYEYMIFLFKGFSKERPIPNQESDSSITYVILINKYLAMKLIFVASYDEKRIVLQVEQVWLRFKGHIPPTSSIHLVVGEMDNLNKRIIFGRIWESLREMSDLVVTKYMRTQNNIEKYMNHLNNYDYEEDEN